jgi:hypothetical protein
MVAGFARSQERIMVLVSAALQDTAGKSLPGRTYRWFRPLHAEDVGADCGGSAAAISTNIFFLWAAQPPTACPPLRGNCGKRTFASMCSGNRNTVFTPLCYDGAERAA